MKEEILFERHKKYLLTALFIQKMLEERNSTGNALNFAVFSTKSGGFVVLSSSINCDLYHYAGNNPVKYVDPTGREDESLIKAESKVKLFLENVKSDPENYKITAYQRRALNEGKQTKILTHSLYVIHNDSTKEDNTLSFNGTKIGLDSKGAWAIDTNTDVKSFDSYEKGDNVFDMQTFIPSEIVDVKKTAENVIDSINSNTTYFALDHQHDVKNAENCNTALLNTGAIKKSEIEE